VGAWFRSAILAVQTGGRAPQATLPRRGLWRQLLSGNRERISKAVAEINAAGQADDYAGLLIVARRRRQRHTWRVFGRCLLLWPYSERERRSALTALGALWGPLGREIAVALDAKATHLEREHAHNTLIRRHDQRAVRPLIDALLDGHALEDWRCISTLGALSDLRAADALIRYMHLNVAPEKSLHGERMRTWALECGVEVGRALRRLRATSALEVVLAALKSASPFQRAGSALVLGGWGDPAYAQKIVPLLRDADPTVRESAATALGDLREEPMPAVADALRAVLSDSDPKVAAAAERSLQQIATAPSRRKLRTDFAGLPRHASQDGSGPGPASR
jgi:HEAT repeat protein